MASPHEVYNEGEKLKDDGKFEEAIEKYLQVIEMDPQDALPHFALAVAYGKIGDHEKAVQHGEKAVELDPSDPFSYTALSVTYQRAYAGTQNTQYIQMAEDAMARSHMIQAQQNR